MPRRRRARAWTLTGAILMLAATCQCKVRIGINKGKQAAEKELGGTVGAESLSGLGRALRRDNATATLSEPGRVPPPGEVIEIDYKRDSSGGTVIQSHELMLRHAPGVFGFASRCELGVAADHCAEPEFASTDPFCRSGMLSVCLRLLPSCETFETRPPCRADANECCRCAFQMCPLVSAGCKRIDRECYSQGVDGNGPKEAPRSLAHSLAKELPDAVRTAIQKVFSLLDLDKDGTLGHAELSVLLSAFSSAHTKSWAKLTPTKFTTIRSELGAEAHGVAVDHCFKAFRRRRGMLYNMMLRAVTAAAAGRKTRLEEHAESIETIFKHYNKDENEILSAAEFAELSAGDDSYALLASKGLSLTDLKMLYLETHFRNLDEDMSTLTGGVGIGRASAWVMVFGVTLMLVACVALFFLLKGSVKKNI